MAYYIYTTMYVPDLAFKQEGQFLKSEDIHQHIRSSKNKHDRQYKCITNI